MDRKNINLIKCVNS